MTTTGSTPSALVAGAHSSNDFMRQRNLSAVLTMLHHDGPQSRTELGRRTGLTRSTIAVLASELADLDLVRDLGATAVPGQVGRPSALLEANSQIAAIAIHPETDAITVGVVGLGGVLLRRVRYDTAEPASARETVRIVRTIVDGMRADLGEDCRIVGAGVAIPGMVNASDGRVLLAPHLGWKNESIATALSRALGVTVVAGNDASVGAMGEFAFGAAREVKNLVYANGTVSGIGGGVIIDGVLLRGMGGFAGEMGHTLVNSAGRRCHCGRIGCLETEVSLERLLPYLGRERIDEDELDIALGLARDPALLRELSRQVEFLSEALTNFVNLFSPDTVVLAGYLGALLSVSRERLTDAVRLRPLGGHVRAIRLERAQLRSRLLLVGAAELVFEGRVLPVHPPYV